MSEQNSSKTTQLPLTENENLLAHQPETVETLVPAASRTERRLKSSRVKGLAS